MNTYRKDCFYFSEVIDFGGHIPFCCSTAKLEDCPCRDCKNFISQSEAYQVVRKYQNGAIIDAQPTVDEWISVRERLPEEGGEYLAGWYGSDDVVIARFTRDCFGMNFRLLDPEKEHRPAFYYEDDEWGTCELEDVECWIQRPVPPKEAP